VTDIFSRQERHRGKYIKPGLSGLWQISGRSRLTYPQRRRLDLFLIEKWSIPFYFRILLLTFPRVVAGKDAW